MSRISAHSSRPVRQAQGRSRRGFTLVEIMVSMSVSLIVVGGVLAAYVFLGRNLARMVNVQHQQMQSRRTLEYFKKDLSQASGLSTATTSQITLTKPVASGDATISYTYSSGTGTLVRSETLPSSSTTTLTILSNLTSFTFNYYNGSGTAVTSSPQSVKTVEFSFASTAGAVENSTQTTFNSVSPRVVLRNKPTLQ